MQKIELEKDPSLLLSRSNVPLRFQYIRGIYKGNQVLYIITDGSDKEYTKTISDKQGWNVELASTIADVPEDTIQKLFIFKNGITGKRIYTSKIIFFSNAYSFWFNCIRYN
ncbi:MAG: DUF7482 domain-containing protein [Nitrosopumilus sp.]